MPCASSVSDNWHFAPIRREDFPLFASWLATSHVRRWWNDEPDLDAIEADYGTVVDGTEPAKVFIAHFEGRAVGLIQSFRFDAYAFYFDDVRAVYRLPANACTIDYLIGPPEALGRGLGSSMIRAFVAALWAPIPIAPRSWCRCTPIMAPPAAPCCGPASPKWRASICRRITRWTARRIGFLR